MFSSQAREERGAGFAGGFAVPAGAFRVDGGEHPLIGFRRPFKGFRELVFIDFIVVVDEDFGRRHRVCVIGFRGELMGMPED